LRLPDKTPALGVEPFAKLSSKGIIFMTAIIDYCGVISGKPFYLTVQSINKEFIGWQFGLRLSINMDSIELIKENL
jgi:hypothetical protein